MYNMPAQCQYDTQLKSKQRTVFMTILYNTSNGAIIIESKTLPDDRTARTTQWTGHVTLFSRRWHDSPLKMMES